MKSLKGLRKVGLSGAFVLAILVLCPSGAAHAQAAPKYSAIVERVEWEVSDTGARVIVVVRGEVAYNSHAMAPQPGSGQPARAYVDLKPARLGSAVRREAIPVNDRLLRRIRIGQFNRDTARIVVDLAEPALFHVTTARNPTRLIMQLVPPRDPPRPARVAPPSRSSPRERSSGTRAGRRARGVGAGRSNGAPGLRGARRPVGAHTVPMPTSAPRRTRVSSRSQFPPTPRASARPTARPTAKPTARPSPAPTVRPTSMPTASPTPIPTASPSPVPTASATSTPSPTATARPTLSPVPTRSPRVYTIVLDPGHGGKDPGARGRGKSDEKSVTLAIAKALAKELNAEPNMRAILTRDSNVTLSLEERTAIANAQGADLFLSIHANAAKNRRASGIETYSLNNSNDQATIRLSNMENGLSIAGAEGQGEDLAYILSDLLQTGKEGESIALAEAVQGELVRYLRKRWKGVNDLGVKKGPFFVLVGAYMPCVLIEVGFLTNSSEGARLTSAAYQRAIAEGIRLGLRKFLNSSAVRENL